MVVVIHQPHFLPWLGYFNKLAHADRLIVLDNVQYNIREYQNRARIRNMNGNGQWVTLATGSHNYGVPINNVRVVNEDSIRTLSKTIHHSYAKSPFYQDCWPPIRAAIESGYPSLVDINVNSIREIVAMLEFSQLKIVRASDLINEKLDATTRLIRLASLVGADRMILGEASWLCHDIARIRESGIKVCKQVFLKNHPQYTQRRAEFLPGLSVIDALFNVGPDQSAYITRNAWSPAKFI